ncbi:hypothetical protein ACR30T_07790 [Neisseria gonorrhoeae]
MPSETISFQTAFFYIKPFTRRVFSKAATAGSSLPSKNSRNAPPPVEM